VRDVVATSDSIDPQQELLIGIVIRGMRRTPTDAQIRGLEESASLFDKGAAAARDVAFEMRACAMLGPLFGNAYAPGWPPLAVLDKARRRAVQSLGGGETGKWHRFEIVNFSTRIAAGLDAIIFSSTPANSPEVELQKIYGHDADRVERLGFAFRTAATWLRTMNAFSIADRRAAQAARKGNTGAVPELNEQRMLREADENSFDMTALARTFVGYLYPKESADEQEERALALAKSFQKRRADALSSDGNAKKSKRRN
jgi:hypothetical protein